MNHKFTWHGKGEGLWAECSCGWCWTGTYEMPGKRRQKAVADHQRQLARTARAAWINDGMIGPEPVAA